MAVEVLALYTRRGSGFLSDAWLMCVVVHVDAACSNVTARVYIQLTVVPVDYEKLKACSSMWR